MMSNNIGRRLIAFGAVSMLSCSDSASSPVGGPDPAIVASLEVAPPSASVAVGATLQLTAIARDATGNVLAGPSVTWSSSSSGAATVSRTGLVTGETLGAATITATSAGKSATTEITVVAGRSLADRADDLSGSQVHVMYVIPADGEDRQLDLNGTLARSVTSFRTWFTQHSAGLDFRFDTFEGALDITFHRLALTNAEMIDFGAYVVNQIEQELRDAERIESNKLYIVYYDGGSTFACGGAAWPPFIPGQVAAMYLRGTPGGADCGAQQFVTSATQFPRYWEFAMLHDLVHTLGVVAEAAPNHTTAYPGHVPDRNDLMYSGPASWIIDATTVIDVGGDDYFGSSVPAGVAELGSSPFLTSTVAASFLRVAPPGARAVRELAAAFEALPPHAPFPLAP